MLVYNASYRVTLPIARLALLSMIPASVESVPVAVTSGVPAVASVYGSLKLLIRGHAILIL
jgi:hypothetical protein